MLTIAFVLLGEILIYVPSISRFRKDYLEERIAIAHLATLALEARADIPLPRVLEATLLDHAGVLAVTLRTPSAEPMLGKQPSVDRVFDLREATMVDDTIEALRTLRHGGNRIIRVIGPSPQSPEVLVDISLLEEGLWRAMVGYSWRILNLSIVLSLLTAILVFATLRAMIVRPLTRITESVIAFREQPESVASSLPPSSRPDEIGIVQNELVRMQNGLRVSLAQKTRLAALGAAVGKINHDLRNILSSALLLSDRIEQSLDPKVRTVAPRLVEAMDRAARLCAETLTFARTQEVVPKPTEFALKTLVDEVATAVLGPDPGPVEFRNEVRPEVRLDADRDQMFRVLMNLVRNAQGALPDGAGRIAVAAFAEGGATTIEVEDTGTGIPERIQNQLFEAFKASTRPGGTGLGLAIAREIIAAHGGRIELARTSAAGTTFRIALPAASRLAA